MINKLLILAAVNVVLAVDVETIYCAKYGNNIGEYKYERVDGPSEAYNVPNSFYIYGKILIINDNHNWRIQIVDLNNKNCKAIKYDTGIEIMSVGNNGEAILGFNYILQVKDGLLEKIVSFKDDIKLLRNGLYGLMILKSQDKYYFIDSKYKQITLDSLPSGLIDVTNGGGLYLIKEKAIISDDIKQYRKCLKNKYKEMTSPNEVDTHHSYFEFQKSGILKDNFGNKITEPTSFLSIDEKNNSYWSANTDKCLYGNKDECFISVQGIFKFDKLGNLINWFYEPEPTNGWKKGARIVINDGYTPFCNSI